jgi:hypothetical protein
MVEALAPASWNKSLRALRRIISAEESWMKAPDSNKEWAQTYANKSSALLFVLELLLKKEGAREQTRLEEKRTRREVEPEWIGIKALRDEPGWSLVEEGGEGLSSASFFTQLNERHASACGVELEEGVSFMDSLRKWAGKVERKVVILTVLAKGSGAASLVTIQNGEAPRPIRVVRWEGRLWWVTTQGVSEGNFNIPLPSILDAGEARQRGFRTAMGVQALGSASVSNTWHVQKMWNWASSRAKVTGANRKEFALVPSSMHMSARDVYGTCRTDCLTLMSTRACDDKLGSR